MSKKRKPKLSRRQICAAIQMQIDTLRDSFTDRIGPTKGQITNSKIRDEIGCLECAIQLVRSLPDRSPHFRARANLAGRQPGAERRRQGPTFAAAAMVGRPARD
jgi:hypothetical protein